MKNKYELQQQRRDAHMAKVMLFVWALLAVVTLSWNSWADDTALMLARTCVAEISFKGTVEECRLMIEVNAHNARDRGRTLKRQTLLFNSFWKVRRQQKKRPWIKYLTGRAPPKYWPRQYRWEVHRDKWMSYLNTAIDFVKNPTGRSCAGVIDYGAPREIPASNLRRADCGETLQWYWRR
ncbi:MAG: hypothetical protein GY847_28995 [Proteobacteria bacterium]|nr:hypothetical protein [Pseudomonadota bacterium]